MVPADYEQFTDYLMKACFLLQRRFAYIGHELAMLLKERHGITEFCAYVNSRERHDFLRAQTNVAYTSLLLDQDIHEEFRSEKLDMVFLRQLEREYGLPTLWSYIENDRIVRYGQLIREYPYNTSPYTHEEMLRIIQVKAKRILAFLESERPDFVVLSVVTGIGSMLLYEIAKKKGITTLVIIAARVDSQHVVSEHYSRFTGLPKEIDTSKENREKAEKFLERFRKSPTPYTDIDVIKMKRPGRARHFRFFTPRGFIPSLRWIMHVWARYFSSSDRFDYDTIKPWYFVLDIVRRKLRILRGYRDLYDTSQDEKYVLFPLHLEPEMALMLYAPVFNDQQWLIKLIAKSLPAGYKVYVKEHPSMFGYRTREFYKELKKVPNVKLIDPAVSGFQLIQNAQLIVTISSTLGWEAIGLKKPVITFGEVFYNALPFVRNCTIPEELPRLITEQLTNFNPDDDTLIQFIASIYQESANVDLIEIWDKEAASRVDERREELARLAELIYRKVTA